MCILWRSHLEQIWLFSLLLLSPTFLLVTWWVECMAVYCVAKIRRMPDPYRQQTISITLKLSFSEARAMHHTRRGDAAVNQGQAHADVAHLPGPLIDSKTNATTRIPPLTDEWNGPGRGALKTIHPHNWERDKNSVRGRSLSQTLSTCLEGGGASLSPALSRVNTPTTQWVEFR